MQSLASELALTVTDGEVWLAIGQGLIFAVVCLLLGVWAARSVGLLDRDAPSGETLAVGLAAGLMVGATWWATVFSGGRSAFTPVAVGFAIALLLARLGRAAAEPEHGAPTSGASSGARRAEHLIGNRRLIFSILLGAGFIAAFALVYGSTMTLSPRDGVQPLEFMDEAFYSVLGADLAKTGTETIYSPSGFSDLDGLPAQTWYHWGELWLASAVITVFDAEPLAARHFVVLPVLLLAAGALTGTILRSWTGATSRGSFIFGFAACLFLAPVPLIAGPYFASWAVGLVFGITLYGLGAVAVLLAIYCAIRVPAREGTWAWAGFVGTGVAFLVPAHIVIALLALVGFASASAIRLVHVRATTRSWPVIPSAWRRTLVCASTAMALTLAWGLVTDHGIGGSASSTAIATFNDSWRDSVLITSIGAGAILAIPCMGLLMRRRQPMHTGLYIGTCALLVIGAIAWGARLGDFNMFHVFFAGIAVFATPVAAIAAWSAQMRLRESGRPLLALAVVLLCIVQLEIGVATTTLRLQRFGPHDYAPVPVEVMTAIGALPADGRLAYSCRPFEEFAFWLSKLLGIDAHTGRRMVAMCFQAEFLGIPESAELSPDVMNPLFERAPQRSLYPDAAANPTRESIVSFMRMNGILYIYADPAHPNTLVPEAVVVDAIGGFQLLRLP